MPVADVRDTLYPSFRPFSLASHLAGVLFGGVYYFYGMEFWDYVRFKCCKWQKLEKLLLPGPASKALSPTESQK